MPEDQIEKKLKEKVAEVGEWFNPFRNYEDIPYSLKSKNHHEKEIHCKIRNIREIGIFLTWPNDFWDVYKRDGREMQYLLTLPTGSTSLKGEDIIDEQRKIETRILSLEFYMRDEKWSEDEHFPYFFEIQLPDGAVIKMPNVQENIGHHPYFEKVEGNDIDKWYRAVLIPETENILDKIQMRIVPIEENNV